LDEVDLKYRTRDSTLGSLVFSRSKGGEADGEPLPGQQSTNQLYTLPFDVKSIINYKEKVFTSSERKMST
jgi:hypothetical protein